MPVAAAIAGGAALAAAAGQMYAQGKMNKRSEKYNWDMYKTQRYDALADWNMQNQYNSPAAQMARYKEAGLNPNLIYGQTQEAGQMRSAESKGWNPQAPDVQQAISGSIGAYQDTALRAEQTNLVKKQVELAEKDKQIKDSQKLALDLGIADKTFNLDLKKDTRDLGVDYKRALLNKIEWDTDALVKRMNYEKGDYEMRQQKNSQAIENMQEQIRASEVGRKLSLAQMAKIREETGKIRNEKVLQEYEIKVQKLLSNVGGNVPANMLFQTIMKILGK